MELEDDGGSARIFVGPGSRTTELGRGRGFASADRSVSRRHVSFHLAEVDGGEARVSFDVLGKNPVVVVFNGGTKKLFRKGQVGELAPGDRLSLSLKRPVFFSLKCLNDFGEFESRFLSSNQSPIEEFGFLERGHEFDRFLGRIREPGAWNWFLEEEEEMKMNSDSEEEATKRKKKRGRKEKGRGEEDEDWTGESEEEKTEAAMAGGSGRRSRYLTRSGKTWQSSPDEDSARTRGFGEDDDPDDETLGGFIVGEMAGQEEEEEEEAEEEEEEEEFEEEDDDDD
ncbi:SMAD/FHA domain-containing protein [Wolffia australiana]